MLGALVRGIVALVLGEYLIGRFVSSTLPTSKAKNFLLFSRTYWGGTSNKDYSILGSILGVPYSGKLPFKTIPDLRQVLFAVTSHQCLDAARQKGPCRYMENTI